MRTLIALLCLTPLLCFGQARRMMLQPFPVVSAPASVAPSSLITNLVAFWNMDSTNNEIVLDITNAHNLIPLGAPPGPVAGMFTNAIDLEKDTTDYLTTNDHAGMSIAGSLSFSTWIKAEAGGSANPFYIAGKWVSGGDLREWEVHVLTNSGDTRISVVISPTGTSANNTNVTLGLGAIMGSTLIGNWVHFAFSLDADGQLLSIWARSTNGLNRYTNSLCAIVPSDLGGVFQIGRVGSTASYFDGMIDDTALWNRALTSNEVLNIFIAGTNGVSFPWVNY